MGTLARIEGFQSLRGRCVNPDKLKKLSKEEKEARLLVAAWQGRQDEVGRVMNSGKPEPRKDTQGCRATRRKSNHRRRQQKPFGNSKAGRGKTVINAISFPKDDLRYGTPLHKAAYRGELDVCKELMAEISGAKAVMLLDECSRLATARCTALHSVHSGLRGDSGDPCGCRGRPSIGRAEGRQGRQEGKGEPTDQCIDCSDADAQHVPEHAN